MKKLCAMVMAAAVLVTATFTQEESKGAVRSVGVFPSPGFGGATDSSLKSTYGGIGLSAFFDTRCLEAGLGLNSSTKAYGGKNDSHSFNWITLGLLVKYPIVIDEKLSIAPAAGFRFSRIH